jgi:hypothetical protein
LTVDEEVFEAQVEVRVDPSVEVSPEDLRVQFEVVTALQEMVSVLNDGLRGMDGVAAQLTARRETAKQMKQDLPEALVGAVDEYEEAASELLESLARGQDKPFWSQGPRISERLQSLAWDVDGQFAAPTAAQMDYLAELETEFLEKLDEVNTLFTEALPALNARMQEQGIPPILLPVPLEAPAP